MQMGHMRFEPNINVHITDGNGALHKTAITEIKNLNSFNVLERASEYEIQRQIRHWEQTGDLGRKSTYGWDDAAQATVHQRDKEDAQDYRYFPDPDLVPVEVDDAWMTEVRSRIGELPAARRKRYAGEMGLSPADAAAMSTDRPTGDFFEAALTFGSTPQRVCNLLLSHGRRLSNDRNKPLADLGIAARRFAEVGAMIDRNAIAASSAGALFDRLAERDGSPEELAAALGLAQVSDMSAIDAAIDKMLASNPKPLADYRAGKQTAMGALVGMVMKSGKGLNPKMVQERLRSRLEGGGTGS
jgi:aspartyl-tRNA(Asn)/glutamyl-tRNA(Gln) amidotransferase subunit B